MKYIATGITMLMLVTFTAVFSKAATAPDGAALYDANCSYCHGTLANSTKKDRTAAQIQAAINGNVGNMGILSWLTAAEVQAIADALSTGAPPPTDGPTLYSSNCAGCHGTLANSTKKNRTAAQIQSAIDGNVGGMGYLSSLTPTQVQLIADALAGGGAPPPPPADGPTLYQNNCAGCHGTLTSSTKKNRTAAQIQSAIDGNVGGMGYLSTLTAAQVQLIADALVDNTPPPPPPADGPTLYQNNCAGCHGALASSTKKNRTAAQIQSAIDGNVGGMGYLSTLTAAQVQLIADALVDNTPPPPPPADGPTLYQNNCAGCHGALASSTKKNRTAAQIQSAINGNVGGMGYLSTLTAAQVQLIADALVDNTPPPTNPVAPVNVSASATPGTVNVAQQVACVWSDGNGADDIKFAYLVVGTKATGGIVKLHYNNATNKLYMMNNAGNGWNGGFAPGSANLITGAQGTLDCSKTTVTRSGNDLTVSFNIKPAAGFSGDKPLMMYVFDMDMTHPAGWENMGAWTITDGSTPPPPADGPTLYQNSCASCHGTLANSTKKNRTAAQIQSAIDGNVGGMGYLSSLSAAEVQAIADALSGGGTPTSPVAPVNASASATPGTVNVAQQVACVWSDGNGADDIKFAYLVVGTKATGGIVKLHYNNATNKLYMMNNAGNGWNGGFAPGSANLITGAQGTLDCSKTTVTRSGNDLTVSFNIKPAAGFTGDKPLMMYVFDMDMTHPAGWENMGIWTITDGSTPPPPPDGQALYQNSCASCHGTLANSTKKNRTAGQIQSAIDGNVGGMGFLSSLTAAEVQAIADALAGGGTPTNPVAPVNTSASAAAGIEGVAQQVDCVWSDGNGADDIKFAYLTVGTNATGGIIKLLYNAVTGKLYMQNDGANGWNGGFVPGSADVISGANGTLDCSNTTVTKTGNDLTVSFNLTPAAGFNGTKKLLMYVIDMDNTHPAGWEYMADWDISAPNSGFTIALTATVVDNTVNLSWTTSGNGAVSKFHVFRDTVEIAAVNSSPYSDTNLPNATYSYYVTATDAGSNLLGTSNTRKVQVNYTPPVIDGTTLYENNCAGCHGTLASSTKKNRTAAQIQSAIDGNVGGMGFLSSLTPAEVQAIADALVSNTPPPVLDGAQLYANNCAGCHGTLANSTKKNITLTRLQDAIANNTGGMGYLNTLTTAQMQAIVDALVDNTPPPPPPADGPTLYQNNCAGCHGTLANSTKKNRTAAQIQSAINGNVGGMGFLSSLTPAEVQAIADALVSNAPPPPLDGVALYGSNCSGCHGDIANTNKGGRTAAQIQSAIDGNVGGMGYLSSLTTQEVQAIADALQNVAPPPPTDGVGLYNTYCASCHRSISNSQVKGKSASEIQNAINRNKGGMGYLNFLTTTEVQKISDALR